MNNKIQLFIEKAAIFTKKFVSYKWILAVFAVISLLAFMSLHYFQNEKTGDNEGLLEEVEAETLKKNQDEKQVEGDEEVALLAADVKGAVKKPGVYYMEPGSRVLGLIEKAGGFLEAADQTRINLAEIIQDEMMIYVPAKGESVIDEGSDGQVERQAAGKISLNKASIEELQQLPGIGPGKAKLIVEYREESGRFKKKEDLKNVSGIGEKTYEKIAELISL